MWEKEFAKRLSELRLQKDISARDLSLRIGQSESYINKIENGNALPSMTAFFYICEYFNITPAQFFDFTVQSPEKLNEINKNLEKLSPEQLEHVNTIILDVLGSK